MVFKKFMISKLKELKNHQGFMKYFKNTSWLFAEKVLRMVVGLFVGIWVARYLEPEQFGLFSYAQSFVGLFSAIAALGLNGIVVRELVKFPEKEKELLGTAFILKVFGAFITLCLLAVAINFTSNDNNTNILIFIIASAVIFQSFNIIDFYFQAKVMSKYVVFTNSFSLLVSSVVKIVLILNHASVMAFAWVVVFDSLVLSIGYLYWYFRVKKEFLLSQITFDFELAKSLLKDSWPLIIAGLGYIIYSKIDQIMLFNFLSAEKVGYYSVVVNFINMFIFIPTIILNSIYPLLIEVHKINKEKFQFYMFSLYRIFIFLSLLYSFIILFFGKNIFLLLFGNSYLESTQYLFLYSIVFLFESLAIVNGRWVWIKNLQIISLYRTVFGAILNICLNLYLIPLYGINGAIYATLITLLFSVIFFYIVFEKTREITKMQLLSLVTFYNLKGVKQWVKR